MLWLICFFLIEFEEEFKVFVEEIDIYLVVNIDI